MSRSKANLLVHCYSCCLYVDCFVEKILAQSSFFYAVFVAKMPHQYWCLFVTCHEKVQFWKPGEIGNISAFVGVAVKYQSRRDDHLDGTCVCNGLKYFIKD